MGSVLVIAVGAVAIIIAVRAVVLIIIVLIVVVLVFQRYHLLRRLVFVSR